MNLRRSQSPVPNLPLGSLREPQPKAAYAYWLSKRGTRSMPAPGDIDPAEIPRLLPYITLIQVLHEEPVDYLYRIEGEAIRIAFGMRRATCRLSALQDQYGSAYQGIRDRLEQIRLERGPLAHISMITRLGRRQFELESVLLPFSSDGTRVERIMACSGFLERLGILKNA